VIPPLPYVILMTRFLPKCALFCIIMVVFRFETCCGMLMKGNYIVLLALARRRFRFPCFGKDCGSRPSTTSNSLTM
jgi:hypothetical protein